MSIQRINTQHGQRIIFNNFVPRVGGQKPSFCPLHRDIVNMQALGELYFEDPVGKVKSRLWKVDGKTFSEKPDKKKYGIHAESTE